MNLTVEQFTQIQTGVETFMQALGRCVVKDEPPVDKWAAEKKAFAEGKVVQYQYPLGGEWFDLVANDPVTWEDSMCYFRIKPWTLPAPPEGRRYHRTDFFEDHLPNGYRPLLHGEPAQQEDEVLVNGIWLKDACDIGFPMGIMHHHTRTRRPLPSLPDPEREAFEKWWGGERGMSIARYSDGEFSDQYTHHDTRAAWDGWTAARKSPRA